MDLWKKNFQTENVADSISKLFGAIIFLEQIHYKPRKAN